MQIQIGDAAQHIDHKQNHVSLFDGNAHLAIYLLLEHIFGIDHPAARIDHRKRTSAPLAQPILAVARCAGLLVHDSPTRLRQAIKQCRFAHVRPTDNSNKISHNISVFGIYSQVLSQAFRYLLIVSGKEQTQLIIY